jgi:SAM-dependent methyltransferase
MMSMANEAGTDGGWPESWRESRGVAEQCAQLLRGRRLGRLLDAGGGEGFLTAYLLDRAADEIAGLDTHGLDAIVLDEDEQLLSEVPPPIRTRRGRMEELGSVDGEFTTILLRQVLHYVRSPRVALRALVRRLRPDGALYVGQIVVADLDAAVWLAKSANWVSVTRRRVWTIDGLLKALVATGMCLEQVNLRSHWQELGRPSLARPAGPANLPLTTSEGTWMCQVHWLHALLTRSPASCHPPPRDRLPSAE